MEEPKHQPQKPTCKSKETDGAQYQLCSSSEDECINSFHGTSGYSPKQNWYPTGLKFPCPLNNHNHETMVCTQFFALFPKDRWDKIEKRKVCWTCMKPKDICLGPKCICYKKVLEILICPACKEVADKKSQTPLKILYCRKTEHKDLRAPILDTKKAWEEYLGKFTCKTPDTDIKISVHFMLQTHCVESHGAGSSNKSAPSINTLSGVVEKYKRKSSLRERMTRFI